MNYCPKCNRTLTASAACTCRDDWGRFPGIDPDCPDHGLPAAAPPPGTPACEEDLLLDAMAFQAREYQDAAERCRKVVVGLRSRVEQLEAALREIEKAGGRAWCGKVARAALLSAGAEGEP